ncbi:alpha/beta hydrolase fold protein [Exidia glandulosa HHB12029]|uniref:Alpha/beta hydrolase fold protein n=1 Tax=Exidia glandulosa HHB12029 TaxID=1314781 RepID=A0A165ZEA1_EXIGL|nr:alpha/beta hydrolase fold protein [Exidia glandulosa HHB12029]
MRVPSFVLLSIAVVIKRVAVNGLDVFYREAGPATGPTVLLLHGYPSSSHQFRHLIPRLAHKYHVVAPDLPGFGFTEVPERLNFKYTFDNLRTAVEGFVDALKLEKFALYIFDYGAPTGLRLALDRPDAITAIISQNGNAYEEGFGKDFWAPIMKYWADPSPANREALRPFVSFNGTKQQYINGAPDPSALEPEAWHLDSALLARPGNVDVQLDLFLDYGTNVAIYPKFHQYFHERQPPFLAIWGKNDVIFVPPGAEAFKRDLPHAQVEFVDAGHFALESHVNEIAEAILKFLERNI